MIILEIPQNPTFTYVLVALGTAAITKLVDYLLKRSDNSSKIEIAKLNISEKEYEVLKGELKKALELVKKLSDDIDLKDKELSILDKQLSSIKADWKAVRFAFQILFKGYERIFKDDEDSLAMLTEMWQILNKQEK